MNGGWGGGHSQAPNGVCEANCDSPKCSLHLKEDPPLHPRESISNEAFWISVGEILGFEAVLGGAKAHAAVLNNSTSGVSHPLPKGP